jgi:hypothetical protein
MAIKQIAEVLQKSRVEYSEKTGSKDSLSYLNKIETLWTELVIEYQKELNKMEKEFWAHNCTNPIYTEQEELNQKKHDLLEKYLVSMSEMIISILTEEYNRNSDILTVTQKLEDQDFQIIRTIEKDTIRLIHEEDTRINKEMGQLDLDLSEEVWIAQEKKLLHLFEKNPTLAKHMVELQQQLTLKKNQDMEMKKEKQNQLIEAKINAECGKLQFITADWQNQLGVHHNFEKAKLDNQLAKSKNVALQTLKKIAAVIHCSGFSRFSTDAENDIDTILNEEDDFNLGTPRIVSASKDKTELFRCIFEFIYNK